MFVIAFSMPVLGAVIDRVGRRTHFILFGGILNFIAHFIYFINHKCEENCNTAPAYIIFVLYGVSYAIFIVAGWSSLAFIVQPDLLATAYGIMTVFLNTGYTLLPPLISAVHTKYESY